MMNMQNANCCAGCFYAGIVNGYKPDCNCMKAAEAKSRDNKSTNTGMVEDYWDVWNEYIFCEESDFSESKDRSKTVRNRINKAKARKKAVALLPVVTSKANKAVGFEENHIQNKRLNNVAKTAKRRYRMAISIPFPTVSKSNNYGNTHEDLCTSFITWQNNAKKEKDYPMVLACKNAIANLETAILYGGELSSLHCEGSTLHLKVGFLDKNSMLNFKKKTSLNS